jgi:hypothetical protein
MDAPVPATKDARFVAGGKKAMLKRWGPPRIIDLHGLAPEQRAFIAELVEVARRNLPALAADPQAE